MRQSLRKLWWMTQRSSKEADLRNELQFHLQEEATQAEAAGMRTEQAKWAARRELGNVTLCMEDTRATWGWTSLERFWQDLRYAARMLRKNPGFAAAVVLSLALGIGANTAIFSLLNSLVIRPLPVAAPQQLVQFTNTLPLWETGASTENGLFSYPQLERFQARAKALSGIFGGTGLGRITVGFHGTSGLAQGDAYTDNFFSVLGVTPQHGRFFSAGEDRAGASVAVIGDAYWRDRFAADPAIVGGSVTVNRIPFTVIGITPREFRGISAGSSPDIWVPLHALDRLKPDSRRWTEPLSSWLLIAGRLRPEVPREQAQAELDGIHRQFLAEVLPASGLGSRENVQRFVREGHLVLQPAASGMSGGLRDRYAFPLKLLMWVAGIVLLVACANIANLLLARASNRRREIATRLALGASRGRLVRQLLAESVVLALLGGALAVPLAWWGSLVMVRMISTGDSPPPLVVDPDWRTFAFTAAASLLTGMLFGLVPAVRGTRVDPGPVMKEGMRQAGRHSHTLDRLLVVTQVALSVVLVAGAGLFVRTLGNLRSVDTGYDRQNVLMISVDAGLAGYSIDRAGAVYSEILRRLRALPEVKSASASVVRPVDDQFHLVDQVDEVDGAELPGGSAIRVAWNAISPDYFSTVRTPIVAGRDFAPRDNETAPRVVIVNESLAKRAFPNRNPIGHRLGPATIVGVVKDSRYSGARDQPRPVLYHPLFQHGRDQEYRWGYVSFELRYGSASHLLDEARREVASVDRNLPVFRIRTLLAQAEQSMLKERLLATLSSFFGVLALLLACVGLYGLMAYAVARRTSEIGIRLALGAPRDRVMWLVLGETLCLTLTGVAVGIPLALWAAQYAKSVLFGIGAADPLTMAATVAILIGVAVLAGYLPARRALRVDPMVALRYE
ncbi:MAG: ABC transporter permease [Candidatus Solibacter sp.]|jgi:predicted permease